MTERWFIKRFSFFGRKFQIMQGKDDLGLKVFFEEEAVGFLRMHFSPHKYSKVVVLVDDNTQEHCLPIFREILPVEFNATICISPGEENKNLNTCEHVWQELSTLGCDRKSLLICLGGGVLTDLGGFVAATYKRGMACIQVPTTLLAMVDASVGGKTGIDFGMLKNQIGVIIQPVGVLIFPKFLKTLDQRQLNNGKAEMFKHGLIANANYWNDLINLGDISNRTEIEKSVQIKSDIVTQDPYENGIRKALNFGHTLGHAVESYYLEDADLNSLLHGEAIGIGMIMEAYLSNKLLGLPLSEVDNISKVFKGLYGQIAIPDDAIENIINLTSHDKKNSFGTVNYTLLQGIGKAKIDVQVPDEMLSEAFAYYNNP